MFKNCVRRGYSLRGLPANHFCPECGLRFDVQCALYRVANPRQLLAFWFMILGGGWVSLKNLPPPREPGGRFGLETVGTLAGTLWVVFVVAGVWFFIRRYRRGFEVAITSDGLILCLPGNFDDDGDVDLDDFNIFAACMDGPDVPAGPGCEPADLDADGDVDLADFARFQDVFTGP